VILADTSVWVQHFRSGDERLVESLNAGQICIHPFIIGELACGNLKNRADILELLHNLPLVSVASDAEALAFLEERALIGRGIGYIDVHLLAAAALNSSPLRTRDKRLDAVAIELKLNAE
jgi:predicted nucleic acid-binding protein